MQYFAGNPGEFSQDFFRLCPAHQNEKGRRVSRNGAAQCLDEVIVNTIIDQRA